TRVVKSIPATRARLLHQVADVAPQQQVRQLLRALREPLQVAERGLAALRAPRAQGWAEHRLEQAALAVGRGTEGAQVPRLDPEARERLAGRGDFRVALGVDPLPVLDARLQQPELLELAGSIGGDAGAVAELLQVELLLPRVDHAAAPATLLAGTGFELLPDHAQRQELVALQAQNRLQPLDVVLREEPVATLRAPRVQQPLVLEVADLRDRDLGELVLEPIADRADREEPATRWGFRH